VDTGGDYSPTSADWLYVVVMLVVILALLSCGHRARGAESEFEFEVRPAAVPGNCGCQLSSCSCGPNGCGGVSCECGPSCVCGTPVFDVRPAFVVVRAPKAVPKKSGKARPKAATGRQTQRPVARTSTRLPAAPPRFTGGFRGGC